MLYFVGWAERSKAHADASADLTTRGPGAEPVIGPARGPHRASAMGCPDFGPDPLAPLPTLRLRRSGEVRGPQARYHLARRRTSAASLVM